MSPSHKVTEVKPLDVTWWRRDRSGEFYTQQDGEARLVKLRNGRKVTGWILYIRGEYRGQWSTLAQAKHQALKISKGCPKELLVNAFNAVTCHRCKYKVFCRWDDPFDMTATEHVCSEDGGTDAGQHTARKD